VKLGDIAARLECSLNGDGGLEITGVVGIEKAEAGHLTFVSNPKYASQLASTRAAAILVSDSVDGDDDRLIRVGNPYFAMASVVAKYFDRRPNRRGFPTASIAPTELERMSPSAIHDDDVEVGQAARSIPSSTPRGVRAGDLFRAYAHVSVREFCRIGNNVILQDGAKIGTDGYGYAKRDDGSYYKIVQSGIVVLEDDVEIGANSTIDRATIGETRIRRGAKIDNLVQIGHSSDVGEDTLLCSQVGLAGSSKIGRSVILTGQVGVAGHLEIGDRVIATAQTGIPNSIEADKVVSGSPSMDNKIWLRSTAPIKRLRTAETH
jgi:UDP-3-O-[3-hydroxymyristoyl] glucosamine N-acyltransferase